MFQHMSAQPITDICSQEHILLTDLQVHKLQQLTQLCAVADTAAAQVDILQVSVSAHHGPQPAALDLAPQRFFGRHYAHIPVQFKSTSFSSCLAAARLLLCAGARPAAVRLLLYAGARHSLSSSQLAAAAPSRSCRRSSSSCKQRVQHSAAQRSS
jgi:hypothetical protein